MCYYPKYQAKCGCTVIDQLKWCERAKKKRRQFCQTEVIVQEEGEWVNEYCPEHEILRRQHDGMRLVLGKETEHDNDEGFPKDEWARYLRVTRDLLDYEYYKKYPSLDNPWWAQAWGVQKQDIAKEVVESLGSLKKMGERRETWREFQQRVGTTLPPWVPLGYDYTRQIGTFLRRSHDTMKRVERFRSGQPLSGLGFIATGSALDNDIKDMAAKRERADPNNPLFPGMPSIGLAQPSTASVLSTTSTQLPTLTPLQQSKIAAMGQNTAPRQGDDNQNPGREGSSRVQRQGNNGAGVQRGRTDEVVDQRRSGNGSRGPRGNDIGAPDPRGSYYEGDSQQGSRNGGNDPRRNTSRDSNRIQNERNDRREGNGPRKRDSPVAL